MVEYGHSLSVRLFEAAGCGACVVSDPLPGLEEAFSVGSEVIVARDEDEMVRLLERLSVQETQEIGQSMRRRALRDHTWSHRLETMWGLFP